MKSVIIREPYTVELTEEERPTAGPGEIVVEAAVSGISSGTEMFLYRGTYPNFRLKKWPQWKEYPVRPGYELAGTVVEAGPPARQAEGPAAAAASLQPSGGVIVADSDEFSPGDRVVCLGTHQQFAKVPATLAAKIPEGVSFEQATLAVLGTTTMHSTRRLSIEYGATVAVIGLGVVGNLALQHARLAGAATTIGIDLDTKRCEYATRVGAKHVVAESGEAAAEAVMELTGGIGADVVVEASGAPGTVQLGLELMRDRGTLELLGWHTEDPTFRFGDLYFKEGRIIATRAIGPEPGLPYAYVRWGYDQSLRLATEMIGDGRLKTNFFKPSRFPFSRIEEAYRQIDADPGSIGLQALIDWKE
jgi:2-desacetyl-2-hydroxyethyl bacteriochlorophyllide A dehydrogenase